MPAVVVVGAQWGDEGKGKVVDLLAQFADVVARYGGGANAGHTLVVGDEQVVVHLVPSGALHADKQCVLGQGMVVDPKVLLDEIETLQSRGLLGAGRLLVSDRAQVVLPHHREVDALRDRGSEAIGTTKRGIGPCYEDKAGRRGLRVGDLLDKDNLERRLAANVAAWRPVIEALGGEPPDQASILRDYGAYGERLRPFVADTALQVHEALQSGRNVLLEGAQGAMLDLDHGTYPFVTSSSVIAGGACTGLGIGPTAIDRVIGITKAYTTRVGGGPFPTELTGDLGNRLREAGAEFGATTGRPRRCGWLDAVALRYAVRINGIAELAITKLDVLAGLPELNVCVAYELDGKRLESPPLDGLERVVPVYETFPGFQESISGCTDLDALPENARSYLASVEDRVGCRLGLISTGPERNECIRLRDPFVGE